MSLCRRPPAPLAHRPCPLHRRCHPASIGSPPPIPAETPTIVVGGVAKAHGEVPSAEVDKSGRPYLADQEWRKMGDEEGEKPGLVDRVFSSLYGNLPREDRLRVAWLAGTLFFIIGG